MEFRAPVESLAQNSRAIEYLSGQLTDPDGGKACVQSLMDDLGGAVGKLPSWHPIMTIPSKSRSEAGVPFSEINAYNNCDHTQFFVRGFVTCPYSEAAANDLIATIKKHPPLHAYRLNEPLYSDNAYPVVVEAYNVVLEADGTIRSSDALAWFIESLAAHVHTAQVAETWWNIRTEILGKPHGSRSSVLVNQHTGLHMRKILDAINSSGVFGPIKEESLDMLSPKKRDTVSETLVRSAIKSQYGNRDTFDFELRGEICQATITDTFKDGTELYVRVTIGDYDLHTNGFYYPKDNRLETMEPRGKLALAKKFL